MGRELANGKFACNCFSFAVLPGGLRYQQAYGTCEERAMLETVLRLHAKDQSREGLGEARKRIAEARENAADELDFQLTFVPEGAFELKQLRTLTLNNNRLTSVPETVFELTSLP